MSDRFKTHSQGTVNKSVSWNRSLLILYKKYSPNSQCHLLSCQRHQSTIDTSSPESRRTSGQTEHPACGGKDTSVDTATITTSDVVRTSELRLVRTRQETPRRNQSRGSVKKTLYVGCLRPQKSDSLRDVGVKRRVR